MDKRPITKPSLAQDSAGSCCATRWMGKLPVRCCHIFFLLAGFLVMSLWVAGWSAYTSHRLSHSLSQLQSQFQRWEEQANSQTKTPSLEDFEKASERLDRLVLTLQEQAEKLHQLEDDLLHLREKGQESPKVESPSEESPTESPPPANHIIDAIAHPAEPHSPESPAAEATVPETQPTAPRLAPANHPINFDHLRAAFKKALPYALDSRTVEETPAWNRLTQGIVTIRKTGPRAESGSVDETLANIEKHLEAQQAQEALVHLRRLPPSMQHPFEDLIRTLTTSLALPQVQP